MRRGYGDPDMPSKEGESFLAYLHRLAQDRGYIAANVAPPTERTRPKRHGQPGFIERLDSIFGRKPGEDVDGLDLDQGAKDMEGGKA